MAKNPAHFSISKFLFGSLAEKLDAILLLHVIRSDDRTR